MCIISEKGEAIVEDLINVKRNAEEDLFRAFNEEDKDIFYEYLSLFLQNSVDLTSGVTHKLEEK